eukprot:404564-Amphidinium_carterae.1
MARIPGTQAFSLSHSVHSIQSLTRPLDTLGVPIKRLYKTIAHKQEKQSTSQHLAVGQVNAVVPLITNTRLHSK